MSRKRVNLATNDGVLDCYVFEPDALTDVTIKWEGDSDAVHGIEPFAHLSPDLTKWAYDPRFIEPLGR